MLVSRLRGFQTIEGSLEPMARPIKARLSLGSLLRPSPSQGIVFRIFRAIFIRLHTPFEVNGSPRVGGAAAKKARVWNSDCDGE